ncbi:MAG: hypothetical protein V4819_06080 [Verrucomicrobiota bacterium]
MKPFVLTILCAALGFLAGIAIPRKTESPKDPDASAPGRRSSRPWTPSKLPPGQRMLSLANHAASLTPEEWPAFFRARMNDPEGTRLAERLWAEQDPAGFWDWLKQQRDGTLLRRYGKNLLHVWAAAQPDAAMRAANAITDKESSDFLRREVVDTVIAGDLAKGLELAAKAGDFNRFSWGPRSWMKNDPSAAVQGLAGLPERSEYRDFLSYAVAAWAEKDSPALLEWLKTQPVIESERWFGDAFKAAALKDTRSALEAASNLTDPTARDAAIAGVMASGRVPGNETAGLLAQLSVRSRAVATYAAVEAMPMKNAEQIEAASLLLNDAPATRNMLNAVVSVADAWGECDWNRGVAWAATLPNSTMRRKALAAMAFRAGRDRLDTLANTVAAAPMLNLSDELFHNILQTLPDGEEAAWIAKLPPERAAWARSVAEKAK